MATSNSNPIATRTRSNKSTTEHSPSHVPSLIAFQETNDNFTAMNTDTNENHPEQQIKEDEIQSSTQDKVRNIEDDKYPSWLNTQSTATTSAKTENSGARKEELINLPCANEQLQHVQEVFAVQLAQTQKIIENQQEILIQQQWSIDELMKEKRNHQQQQQHQELSSQPQMEPQPAHNPIGNNSFKYDHFIEQQILKDKISNIRKFSGIKFDDVDEWLQNIEHDFSSTLISDEIKLKLIPKSLTNDAKNWFEQNKHRILSWTIFKTEIQDRFQSSLHKDQKFIRLRERKQQLKETGQQFIDAMEKLCFQVNPSMMEQEKMLHIKAGLKPSLKEKVFDKQPQSMNQLRDTVKRIEDIEIMLNDGNNNEEQPEHPSLSSNDDNCYALSSHYNRPHYHRRRRNNYYNQYQQSQEMDQQMYQPNQNHQSRNKHNQQRDQYPPNNQTTTNSYSTSTSTNNNNSKKY